MFSFILCKDVNETELTKSWWNDYAMDGYGWPHKMIRRACMIKKIKTHTKSIANGIDQNPKSYKIIL